MPAPADTGGAASLEFCMRLTRAYATLTRRLDNALSNLHGLSFGDFMILYHLERAPGTRLRRIDLAERLGLTASGVTRSLLPLEKLGLVSRQPDPRDARVGYLLLNHIAPPLPLPGLEKAFLGNAPGIYNGRLRVGQDGDFVSMPAGSKAINFSRRF